MDSPQQASDRKDEFIARMNADLHRLGSDGKPRNPDKVFALDSDDNLRLYHVRTVTNPSDTGVVQPDKSKPFQASEVSGALRDMVRFLNDDKHNLTVMLVRNKFKFSNASESGLEDGIGFPTALANRASKDSSGKL